MKKYFLIAASLVIIGILIIGPVSFSCSAKTEIVNHSYDLPVVESYDMFNVSNGNSLICIETIHLYGFLFKDAVSFIKTEEKCNGPPSS